MSTALMYAFSQRPDTRCLDEPLYGHYLRVSRAAHPAARQVMRAMDCDGCRVVADQLLGWPGQSFSPSSSPITVLFCKQMAHHLRDLDTDFLDQTDNVILTRDPSEVLTTLVKQLPQPTLADTGYIEQIALLRRFPDIPVLDAKQLLLAPVQVLRVLCQRLQLPFESGMLSWPAGPKSFDGVWAPHWYHSVHQSTGFAPYRAKSEPLPTAQRPLLEDCLPLYKQLREKAIMAQELDT